MMKFLAIICFLVFPLFLNAQTFIEMMYPSDAQIILLEVKDSAEADICIYKTNAKKEYRDWDLMWNFKKGGFSNFSVYIAKNISELTISAENSWTEKETVYPCHGKVYFVKNKEERGYVIEAFRLEGIMRVKKTKSN